MSSLKYHFFSKYVCFFSSIFILLKDTYTILISRGCDILIYAIVFTFNVIILVMIVYKVRNVHHSMCTM